MTTNNSALILGVRAILLDIVKFAVGLFAVVWAVPGVPSAVASYLNTNWMSLALALGLSTGVATYIVHLLNPNIKNV